ncbi:MAG: PilZ domain-containing protein, partial [Terriglobia bacterium]
SLTAALGCHYHSRGLLGVEAMEPAIEIGYAGGIDRREHRRAHYSAAVEIERGAAIERGHTSNVSLGGMLVEMENPLWVGSEFRARVGLPEGPLEVDCVVKRIIAGTGMGVEFVAMKPNDRERLQKLLEGLPS